MESIIYEIGVASNINDIDEIYSELQESNVNLSTKKQKSMKKKTSLKKNSTMEPLKYDVDGFTVLIGKNNKQNDYLTTKNAALDCFGFT